MCVYDARASESKERQDNVCYFESRLSLRYKGDVCDALGKNSVYRRTEKVCSQEVRKTECKVPFAICNRGNSLKSY